LQQVLPIFFLAKYFPVEIVGYYSLLTRIAWTPLALVAQSVSQVLLRKVAELVQRGDDATQYIHHLSLVLLGIAVIPAIILFWYAESLFGLVFGENWREAGRLLSILGLGFPVRFVASTVSVAIISSGNSKLGAYWKIGAFATTFAMFWAFGDKMTIDDLVVVMMVVDLAIYATYYFVALYSVRHPRSFK
jgi:O-antigen/teichoic acid export membrane protein